MDEVGVRRAIDCFWYTLGRFLVDGGGGGVVSVVVVVMVVYGGGGGAVVFHKETAPRARAPYTWR